jgi:pSer/pThr/pTyr-binding forkhead associated (FHA) protein
MPRILITVLEKIAQPYRFPLDRHLVTLGRGSENDVVIDCRSVSSRHAEMRRVSGGYELRDLGSTNGIKFNDERAEVIALRSGMSLKLGDVAFDFVLTEEEQAALASEPVYQAAPVESKSSLPKLPPLPEKPAYGRSPHAGHPPYRPAGFGHFRWNVILGWIVLAVAAFCLGMALHFKKDTKQSLLDAMWAKFERVNAPAKPAPVVPEAPEMPEGALPTTVPAPDAPAPDAPAPAP